MSHMKQFKVFKHPAGEVQAVKQGWCWPAFFFSYIWALMAKMWVLGAGLLIASFVLGFALALSEAGDGTKTLVNIASLAVNIIFAVNGNAWRENNLLSRGFELIDTVTVTDKESAVAPFKTDVKPQKMSPTVPKLPTNIIAWLLMILGLLSFALSVWASLPILAQAIKQLDISLYSGEVMFILYVALPALLLSTLFFGICTFKQSLKYSLSFWGFGLSVLGIVNWTFWIYVLAMAR